MEVYLLIGIMTSGSDRLNQNEPWEAKHEWAIHHHVAVVDHAGFLCSCVLQMLEFSTKCPPIHSISQLELDPVPEPVPIDHNQ